MRTTSFDSNPAVMPKTKNWYFIFSGLILGASLILLGLTLFHRPWMEKAFIRGSYYILILFFFFWVVTLARQFKNLGTPLPVLFKNYRAAILFSLIISAVVFFSVKPYLRVLSDEAELLAISQSMTYYKRSDAVYAGINYGYLFKPLERATPRRPLMFPFFLNLIHSVLGYKVGNAYILNFITLFALLTLIFILFQKYFGKIWGFAAVLIAACQPHVVETATSAGFDLFSVLFTLAAFTALLAFLQTPSSLKFQLLWVHLVFLALIRYESPLYLMIVLFFLVAWRYVRWEYFKSSYLYAWTPLVLMPVLWQRFVSTPPFQEVTDVSPFSLNLFIKNNHIFFDHFLVSYGKPPVATMVNALGVAGLGLFLFLFLKKQWLNKPRERHLFFICFICLTALWVITTSYYYSDLTAQACSRYFTIFFVLLSLFAVLLLHRSGVFEFRKSYLIALSALFFILYHPLTSQDGYTNALDMPRRQRYIEHFLKHQPAKQFLLITDIPAHFTIYNMGAINFKSASKFQKKIMADFKNHLFEEIYVIQEIKMVTEKPKEATTLEGDFKLETISQLQNSDDYYLRISRVKQP